MPPAGIIGGEGQDFRMPGTWMDTTMRMETHVRKPLAKAHPKVGTPSEIIPRTNLAPVRTRRDIGMLGLMFKCAHGMTHRSLQDMCSHNPPTEHSYETKPQAHRHSLKLVRSRPATQHALLRGPVSGFTRHNPKDADY